MKLSQKEPKIVWKEEQLTLGATGAKELNRVTVAEYCQANLRILQTMIDSSEISSLAQVCDYCEHGAQIADFMMGGCEMEVAALEYDQEVWMLIAQGSAKFGESNQYAFQCTVKAAEFCTFMARLWCLARYYCCCAPVLNTRPDTSM